MRVFTGLCNSNLDLLRLTVWKQLRVRVLLVYLILPILFLFFEVVLDWRAAWFKLLWRDCLELYIVVAFASRVTPSATNYEVFFAPLRSAAWTSSIAGLALNCEKEKFSLSNGFWAPQLRP